MLAVYATVLSLLLAAGATFARHPDEKAILAKFPKGTLTLFGADVDAKPWCNEETLDNPEMAEVWKSGDAAVLLCPGSLDGETNVVTLFRKGKPPKSKKVDPLKSSHRITDDVLRKAAETLQD